MFETGDIVRVKENPEATLGWNTEMNEFCGNVYTVKERVHRFYLLEDAKGHGEYSRNVNGSGYWHFKEEWLEPVEEDPVNIEENDLMTMFK